MARTAAAATAEPPSLLRGEVVRVVDSPRLSRAESFRRAYNHPMRTKVINRGNLFLPEGQFVTVIDHVCDDGEPGSIALCEPSKYHGLGLVTGVIVNDPQAYEWAAKLTAGAVIHDNDWVEMDLKIWEQWVAERQGEEDQKQ